MQIRPDVRPVTDREQFRGRASLPRFNMHRWKDTQSGIAPFDQAPAVPELSSIIAELPLDRTVFHNGELI